MSRSRQWTRDVSGYPFAGPEAFSMTTRFHVKPRRASRARAGVLAPALLLAAAALLPAPADEAKRPPPGSPGSVAQDAAGSETSSDVWPRPTRTGEPRRLPGMQPGGSILLPTQWSLRPTGDQINVGDFPVNVELHPGGRWAAVLHAGYGEHEVVIV